MQATLTIYHDTRRANKDGLYPVKLRLYYSGKEKLYPVMHLKKKLYISKENFAAAYESRNPKGILKDYFLSIVATLRRGEDIIQDLTTFSFLAFDRAFGAKSNKQHIASYFDAVAEKRKQDGDINTSWLYTYSKESLIGFYGQECSFKDIDAASLQKYQEYMVNKGKSLTTISIYLRLLRAVFTIALDDGIVKYSEIPFGKGRGKYTIPSGSKRKKALSRDQVRAFYEFDTKGNEIGILAKDFWLFSYVCNGMNFKDIAELKWSNFTPDGKSFVFVRSKTKKSNNNLIEIVVPVTEHAAHVIKKYGNPKREPAQRVFPFIYQHKTDPEEQLIALQKFILKVNGKLKRIGKRLGFPEDFSTYYARHSYSTNVIRGGHSLEFVQKALGHADMKTTINYFAGFEQETLHEVNASLLDFQEKKS